MIVVLLHLLRSRCNPLPVDIHPVNGDTDSTNDQQRADGATELHEKRLTAVAYRYFDINGLCIRLPFLCQCAWKKCPRDGHKNPAPGEFRFQTRGHDE